MKRKEFFQLVQPLTEKLYRYAYNLVPDDLQAEQLVIDGINACLIKDKKQILSKELNAKEVQIIRRMYFKKILKHISSIGLRRSLQLTEQMRLTRPEEFKVFFNLEPKIRSVLCLRYDFQFSTEEIEEINQIPKYEVIEKLHNGKHLLLNQKEEGVIL